MGESVTIRTGKMGHGKTLNAIREIDQQAFTENRIVYYHNIDGLQPDKLQAKWFEFDNPHEWYELPDHAIIVIDEAADWFPTRDPRSETPEYIKKLRVIRHKGHEIVLIVQDHRFLDVDIRRLCGCHIHFRRILGSNKVARYEFLEASDYDKHTVLANADKTYIKLDKKLFGVYKSASSHHFKIKIPKKMYLFLLLVAVVVILFYYVFNNFSSKAEATENSEQAISKHEQGLMGSIVEGVKNNAGLNSSSKDDQPMSVEQYLNYYKPRIEGLPHTAPVYDKMTEPQTYPKLSCLLTESPDFMEKNSKKIAEGVLNNKWVGCSCYTQQATLYKTPFEVCVNIVENGYFDPAKPDRNNNGRYNDKEDDLYNRLAKK